MQMRAAQRRAAGSRPCLQRTRVARVACKLPVPEKKDLGPQKEPLRTGKLISATEVPAFIQRDDMMDQIYSWATIEAGENGMRNFGMPMKVERRFYQGSIWGFQVEVFKDGQKQTDLGVNFDFEMAEKWEFIGQGPDGFPTKEGKREEVVGKMLEIWKLDEDKVDEDLRSTIRGFCTALASALNKYYAFGSVYATDST